MSDTAIKVSHLKKSYRYYRSNMQKIQSLLFGKDAGDRKTVLRDVSFEIKRGERVGIIATPMSGKTTLMQILAGVITPDSGKVEINGELNAMIDHKLGFESAMTGRANYEVRCRLMGWTGKMIEEHAEKIFKRANLIDIIDEPMKTYRRGSANRLGFTIATEMKQDILIYDETFSFGGKKFINKAVRRLNKITSGEDVTFLMIVDNLARAAKLCERGMVLHKGRILFDGTFEEAVQYYNDNLKPVSKKAAADANDAAGAAEDETADALTEESEDRRDEEEDSEDRDNAAGEVEEFNNRDTYDEAENEKDEEEGDDYQP